jgi:hypothetical protein
MRDFDLSGKGLKLVRYKILFVKRDYEYAFGEEEDLVKGEMSAETFAVWKLAEFLQKLDQAAIPDRWARKKYPPRLETEQQGDSYIHSLPEEDKKYLRVYFDVLERYPEGGRCTKRGTQRS